MKQNNKRKLRSTAATSRSPIIIATVAAVVLVIGTVTTLSRQLAPQAASRSTVPPAARAQSSGQQFITVKVAGHDVQVNPQTGQIKPLTPQEAQQMADGLKRMLNRSTQGLVKVHHEDGSDSIDLNGHFQNVAVARINDDGSISQSCIDNPQAAASFFGIDPKLLGADTSPAQPIKQARPTKTLK
jgi:hypothetical protein